MILKLKLQYFGHLMRRVDSLEKTLMLGGAWGQEEKGMTEDEMVGWHHQLNGHQFNSVQFSLSVMSESLRPHESQHARPPCPSPTPGVHSNSHVHQVGDAIQPSHPLLSPSPPAPNPSQHQDEVAKVLEFKF